MIFLILFSFLFLLFGSLIFAKLYFTRNRNVYELETEISKDPEFAILIPARDESKVIESLLKSIKMQTRSINMKDVFVIVEDHMDPTIKICQKYGVSFFVRKHLECKSKGYALQELIEDLETKKIYFDAYFIIDADNVLDQNFILEMEKDYKKGFGISTGYRNLKNGTSVLSISAGLTYTFINEWINKNNLKYCKNVLLSGTGFYIHGKYIREWMTYPFHTLTEDVELSHYATLHHISMNYNENAIFFDDQPTSFSQSVLQRKRWIKGYFENYLKYFGKYHKIIATNPINLGSIYSMMYGILAVLCLVIGFLFLFLFFILKMIVTCSILSFIFPIFLFLLCYFFLAFVTSLILKREEGKLNYDKRKCCFVIFYHPIFLISYVYVFLLTIIQKNITWEKIEHHSPLK